MVELEVSDGLILREYVAADAKQLFGVIDQNRVHLRAWLPWVDQTRKPADSLAFIQDSQQQINQQLGIALGIFYHDQLIGAIDLHQWDHELRKGAIGYWLIKQHQGKGLMKACALAFITYLYNNLPLNKLELHIVTGNKRSIYLAHKLGFTNEGTLRDSYKMNGSLHNLMIFGLLKKEWRSL